MKNRTNQIFSELSEFLYEYNCGLRAKAQQGVLIFPAGEYQAVGKKIFSKLKFGGITTFIVSGRNIWNPQDPYYEAQRDAARRGLKITRIFLVPHRRFIKEPLVVKHYELDRSVGIEVKFVHVKELLQQAKRDVVPPLYTLDFGLWDNSLVCFIYYQNYEGNIVPRELRISIRPEDLEFARSLINDIKKSKDISQDTNLELDLEEPMLKSAPLMSMLSEVMCKGSQVCTEDCSWYHRVWQYLRIFDVVSTPTWHYSFYTKSLQKFLHNKKNSRILISGTADYSMLAHVLHVCSKLKKEYEIYVLDLCQTPLILCEWYVSQVGKKIKTIHQDIFKFNMKNYFDLVITDAFLTRFPDDDKFQVLRKWNILLRKNGMVITTVRKEKSNGEIKASDLEISKFAEKVFKSAQDWQPFLPESAEKIKLWAQEYAKRMVSFPLKNKDFLNKLLIKSGFSIVQDNVINVKGEMHVTSYIELIAKKIKDVNQNKNKDDKDEHL